MKFFNRTFNMIHKSISVIKKDASIYMCYIDSDDDVLLNNSAMIIEKNIKKDDEYFGNIFNDAIYIIPQYHSAGEKRARTDVLMRIARGLNYFPFAAENGIIYISAALNKDRDIISDYCRIDKLFQMNFGAGIKFVEISTNDYYAILEQRVSDAYNFYVEEHGIWTENFMAKLGDDISRDSFATFLRQRIMASIFDNSPICYPVLPPAKTASWRQMRESKNYDFPSLRGCNQDILQKIFYKYIFIYEQYAISGVVEAQSGDTVIDVGAFIGDTACYFSRKVEKDGKVFAFECAPESIAFAKENMHINKCDNVDIISYALSDKSQHVSLSLNNIDTSAHSIVDIKNLDSQSSINIRTITLDDYCNEHNIYVNFIKADIEGSEMSMLRGGGGTISKYAPSCAICLYHKQNDYWEIPQYLAELCPEYSFWFRCEAEPVLFAKRTK